MILQVIGFIALLVFGTLILIAGLQIAVCSLGFTNGFEPLALIPLIIGGVIIWTAFHLSPFVLSVGVS